MEPQRQGNMAAPGREPRHPSFDPEDYEQDSGNLKLGLGDFVFYSVLSAKAADFGFVAFAVNTIALCMGGTP